MSIVTFWCGVAVCAAFGLAYLVAVEVELRERLLEDDLEPARVACPAGAIVGQPHTFRRGVGVVVSWDVMGDSRDRVEVCARCARGVS